MSSSSSLPLHSAAAAAAAAHQKKATAGAAADWVSSARYPGSVWGDGFLDKFDLSFQAKERYPNHEVLKEEVREMLTNEVKSSGDHEAIIADKLRLIDAVQRLGIGYHFDAEIEKALEKIHDMGGDLFSNIGDKSTDLYHAALRFRLLRQQGFPASQDVFTKLKNNEGRFKEWVSRDRQGLLSLYEAAHLAFNGEDILDEVLSFATKNLKSSSVIQHQTNPDSFQKQIEFALRFPAWKCVPRSLARNSIDFYSENASQNQKLLTFAKMDFNIVQNLHQQELYEISSWWRSLDMATNFPFVRDRLVETYYWIVCAYFEPKFRLARIISTKIYHLLTLLDDTCDNFATHEELRALSKAIERMNVGALEKLPDRMRNTFRFVLDVYDEVEKEIGKTGPTFSVDYAKDELKKLCRAYLVEIGWRAEGKVPTLEEYLINAYNSCGAPKTCTSCFIGMGAEIATREAFEWVTNESKLMKACCVIARLQNDIFSHKYEQKRNHPASSVQCYMKQHGVTEEEAVEFLWKKIHKSWKDIAEVYQKPTLTPIALTDRLLNLMRSCNLFYEIGDGFTNSHLIKDQLTSLLMDPVPL
ncbi:unnamed protein product [Linum trigynum]|uniref:Uncharacterized protein n=1 Tax=Linum trigynum TaxID=586398 RepID=A0AAV2CP53_9ROSI